MRILKLSKEDCLHLKSLWPIQPSAPANAPSETSETEEGQPGSTYPKNI